jgi:TatA/E family protein of Tat protein translocase
MFGSLGGPELLLIFVLALLLFGPRRLPEIGKALGKTVSEFRRATQEFRNTLEREVEMEKLREAKADLQGAARDSATAMRSAVLGDAIPAVTPLLGAEGTAQDQAPAPGPYPSDAPQTPPTSVDAKPSQEP